MREYAVVPVPRYLRACGDCSGREVPAERYVLRLDEAHLVAEEEAFPIYSADAWEALGYNRPTHSGKLMYWANAEQASALADHLASKKRRTKEYLATTLALKSELREKYRALLQDASLRPEHILHLKGLAEGTDYFDAL